VIDSGRLRDALGEALQRIDEAAARSGRAAGSVEIVLAGKYIPAEDSPALVDAGVTVIGENRLQDLEAKRAVVGDALTFDFIGHIQRRKVKNILPAIRLIHSLDSLSLAEEIARRAEGPVRMLVEVNTGEEKTKSGIVPAQLRAFVQEVSREPNLIIGGLMAMPPPHQDPEKSRPHFATLRTLLDDLTSEWRGRHDLCDLSMGTSQDFVVAAEEGATMVRLGRGLIQHATGA
jgi:pyridoxal phosphate enzyme (YggS family)